MTSRGGKSTGGGREMRWAADDLTATWWDDVWPFKDDRADDAVDEEAEESGGPAGRPRPAPETGVPAVRVPAREPAREPAESPAADPLDAPTEGRTRLMAALVAVVAVVGLVAWLETGPGSDERARLTTHRDRSPYAAPIALHRGTSYVRSDVLPSGEIEVTHWIRTRRPVRAVTLRTPVVPGLVRDSVQVTHVQLSGDGRRVPATGSVYPYGPTTFPVPRTRNLLVRYRIAGVLETSGGTSGRALARITTLDVSTSSRLVSTTRTVVGATVLALACTAPGAAMPVPCGTERGRTWSTRLGPGQQDSQVMAQLDLS
jgi:hypothetical protein